MLLLVAAALLTVLTVYSSVFICVSVWSAGAVAAVVLLLSCCVLGGFAVLVAAFVDPGFEVAALWQLVAPPPEELGNVPDFVARPGSCFTCNAVKPPRCHGRAARGVSHVYPVEPIIAPCPGAVCSVMITIARGLATRSASATTKPFCWLCGTSGS